MRLLGQAGDVVLEHDERRRLWRLRSPAYALTVGVLGRGQVALLDWQNPVTQTRWVKAPVPLFGFATTLNGVSVTSLQPPDDAGAFVLMDVGHERQAGKLLLRFRLRHERWGVVAVISLGAFEGILETGFVLSNGGNETVTVGGLCPLSLTLHCGLPLTALTLTGGHYDEKFPPSGFTLTEHPLSPDAPVTLECGGAGRSSQKDIAWFALGKGDDKGIKEGFVGGLAWSGRWRGVLRRDGEAATVRMEATEITHRLPPAAALSSPSAFLVPFVGDWDDAGWQWHRGLLGLYCPPSPADFPWVQFNSWFGWATRIDEATLMREADIAADLGCEVFVVDAGWYDGCGTGDFGHGLGNWVDHRGKFPDGLKALSDYVHRKGMKFGLWVEPERIDLETGLAKTHPSWLAKRDGKVIGGGRYAHLCFGNPEVVEWFKGRLAKIVAEYGVDWLKWDYNIAYGLGCNEAGHGHQEGDGTYAHTQGVYAVKAFLREQFPHLVLEGCASGGHRIDFGILRLVHTYWLSDFTHRAANVRFHLTGAWFALPPRYLNTWVVHEGTTVTDFRSRMGGAFGISARLSEWDGATKERAKRAIAEYKRLRPFILKRRFLLTPQPRSLQSWTVWQFHDPATDSGAVLAFREQAPDESIVVCLKGLSPQRRYGLQNADTGEKVTLTGKRLMDEGTTITIPQIEGSILLWVTKG